MTSHPIDELHAQASRGDEVTIPEAWGQGRATFGGLVGGVLAVHALRTVEADEITVRALTVNFMAPVTPGPARLTTEVLRQGRSATQLESRLLQVDEEGRESVRALALMTLGAERDSSVELAPAGPDSELPAASHVPSIPFVPGKMPDFIAHLELKLAHGTGPYTGAPDGDMKGYLRFREAPASFGLAHLVTLIDAWPLAPVQMLKAPAPGSTMTWTMEFLAPVDVSPESFWRYDVTTDAAHHGYGHTHARLFDEGGRCVAVSRQTVAIFG